MVKYERSIIGMMHTIMDVRNIPLGGVFAFALASIWSLFQMFNNRALHPTLLYWIPAGLVEIVTAWLTYQAVESVRKITRSNISKQERRFNIVLASVCGALALPTLIVSVAANRYEFQGDYGLALLFPISCVACAVATAIPRIKTHQVDERLAKERDAHAETRAKLRDASRKHELIKASRADFDRVHAGLNGKDTPLAMNIALVQAGFLPISEGTIRSRLQ